MTKEAVQPPTITMQSCWDKDGVSLLRDKPSGIFVLTMNRGPNVFNPTLVTLLDAGLRWVEKAAHPKALIITARGKFFSNGLDLEYLATHDMADQGALVESIWRWLARLLVLDCRTVAAVNGHAFGAGLFVALAADFRLVRTHRGYLCWPELNLGMRLAKGFAELTKAKITDACVQRECVLTGKRYDAAAAVQAGIVDEACPAHQLANRAWAVAAAGLPESLQLQNFDPQAFTQMKMELYTDAYRALTLARADDAPQSRL